MGFLKTLYRWRCDITIYSWAALKTKPFQCMKYLKRAQERLSLRTRKLSGVLKARKGIFVIPNEENDIVVADINQRNKMLLYNCSHKNQECFDSYECDYTLNKFAGIEGGL